MTGKIKNKQTKQKGTTLLEIVVAVGIFSVVILSATGIFQSVAEGQRSAIIAQNIQEEIRYAMEIMGREIRMAKIDDKDCKKVFKLNGTTNNKIYNTDNRYQNILYFKNEGGGCVMYSIKDSRLAKTKGDSSDIPVFLTSSKIKINDLKFYIIDNTAIEISIQPKITVMLDIEYIGKKMHKQQMKIQTTISSRYYEEKSL